MRALGWTNSSMCVAALVIGILAHGDYARADFRFGDPVNLGSPPNSAYADMMPSISSDGLEVYFWCNRSGGVGNWDLWSSSRASTDDEWLSATNLGPEVNSAEIEAMPHISADGLELYFSRGSESTGELMVTRRSAKTEPWGAAANLGPVVNSPVRDDMPRLTNDGLELYFVSSRAGGRGLSDIWVAKRPTVTDDWGPPVNLSVVNSGSYDQWVNLSSNSLTLLFQSDRPGGEYGGLYMSKRMSKDNPWTSPVYLGLPMKGSVYTLLSSMSVDGSTLYLSDHINYAPRVGGQGSADMWQVPVVPIIDFNGDGTVDGADIVIMAAHWGEDCPSCDIGPTPFGDGVIDLQDVIALAAYVGKEVDDPSLIARWALDEEQGLFAHDSAGKNDATVVGVPSWQPAGGAVDGALQLDGTTFLIADPITSLSGGPFSLLAWVKGGAPGQVILSMQRRVSLLMADPNGALMTELKGNSRFGRPLSSDQVVTDGDWHRVGFTWNGTHRRLYVDDLLVAEDTDLEFADSQDNLLIGCARIPVSGTFWSGLIDDVRIYDRAVTP